MKKFLAFVALAALWLPCYSMTPKEAFDDGYSAHSFFGREYNIFDDDEREQMETRALEEVRKYVFMELLPMVDNRSIEAADILLRWANFAWYFMSHEELRSTAQQIKAIVLPIEGKSERYMSALAYELDSWGNVTYWNFPVRTYGADTLQIAHALVDEMLSLYRVHARPTDRDYVQMTEHDAALTCLDRATAFTDEYDERGAYDLYQYYCIASLWRDLAKWDSISESEYEYLCNKDSFPFYYPVYDDYESLAEITSYLWSASYRRFDSYVDYLDIALADAQIVKRLYGEKSEAYISAANGYVYALREYNATYAEKHDGAQDTLQCLKRAITVCKEVLKNGQLSNDSTYYMWLKDEYSSRLSLEGPGKRLGKQIDKAVKEVQKTQNEILIDEWMQLQVEHALLAKDYKRAIAVLDARMKTFPPLPNREDDNYGWIAMLLYEPCTRLYVQTYVLAKDYDNTLKYFSMEASLIFREDVVYTKEDSPYLVAKEMVDFCGFNDLWGNAYRLTLRKQFEQNLFEWSEYRKED